MFRYDYPDPKEDGQIVIETIDHEIKVLYWMEELSQGYWIEKGKNPYDKSTYFLIRYDNRISGGTVRWMYMKEFMKYLNLETISHILEEKLMNYI